MKKDQKFLAIYLVQFSQFANIFLNSRNSVKYCLNLKNPIAMHPQFLNLQLSFSDRFEKITFSDKKR